MTDISNTSMSWCPQGIALHDGENISLHPIEKDEASLLPQLSNALAAPQYIYLPMEELLVRPFAFPLKNPKFLDKDILLEELADTAGIEPDDWWLTWRAHSVNEGIAGLVFGLRYELKDELANTSPWQEVPMLVVDGWQRLNHCLGNKTDDVAVIDMDADGVFLGVLKQGVWQGMRRLNADMSDADVRKATAQQTIWSLQSMGFDAEIMPVLGNITDEFVSALASSEENQQAKVIDELYPRYIANLNLPQPNDKETLNLRHGSWASRKTSANLQAWYRPAIITAAVLVLWLGMTVAENYRLESQIADFDASIAQAFHRGLPKQPVIIDALAQLRQAAGGQSTSSKSDVGQQLYIVSQAFKDTPWDMQSLSINKAGTSLAGKVQNLNTLNTIKEKLSKFSSKDVQIADTDLKDNEVAFKVRW